MSLTTDMVVKQATSSAMLGAVTAATVYVAGMAVPDYVQSSRAVRDGVAAAIGSFGSSALVYGVSSSMIPAAIGVPVVSVLGNETVGLPIQSGLGNVALNYIGPYTQDGLSNQQAFVENAVSTAVAVFGASYLMPTEQGAA